MHLFVIYIGGSHSQSLIELHDMRLVIAETIEDTYPALRESWWGKPESLHIDAWGMLNYADGHSIYISDHPQKNTNAQLYFVNLGGYDNNQFTELHRNVFVIAENEVQAKQKALQQVQNWQYPHRDYCHQVENIVNVNALLTHQQGYHLCFEKALREEPFEFTCLYTPIGKPQRIIASSHMVKPITEKKPLMSENSPRILLVEDNFLIQNVTQSLLSDSGFVVDIAGTGAEALEKFASNKYDLVYMDIGLPDQDGYAVTQALRQHEEKLGGTSSVPVIALTAHGAMDVETFCTRAGMQGVISKPLTREQANAISKKFGLGKAKDVSGLTVIPQAEVVPLEQQIVDMNGTIDLLGSREYSEELLALWHEMLTNRFLPALNDFIKEQDYEALRHELHTMLGSLCYVKTPLLNQAVMELQTAVRSHPNNIVAAYEHVLREAELFIAYYQKKYA